MPRVDSSSSIRSAHQRSGGFVFIELSGILFMRILLREPSTDWTPLAALLLSFTPGLVHAIEYVAWNPQRHVITAAVSPAGLADLQNSDFVLEDAPYGGLIETPRLRDLLGCVVTTQRRNWHRWALENRALHWIIRICSVLR
jgi:hypothetical protein